MRKLSIIGLILLGFVGLEAQTLKPYIMAGIETGDYSKVVSNVEKNLKKENFEILGKHFPMQDKNRTVICATHPLIKDSVNKIGGLTALASVLRFGIYKNGDKIEISYTNPPYWGNAYFRTSFPQVENNYKTLASKIETLFKGLKEYKGLPYGSKKGIAIEKLRKYRYMIAMPRFGNVVKVAKGSDHDNIVKRIRKNLSRKISGAVPVYEITYPGKKLTLFGVGLYGQRGENKFLPKIDYKEPKHITFLPYELLVMENQVVMLHGRYRIALSFPDLSLGTFMKIVSTPPDIENTMRLLTIVK